MCGVHVNDRWRGSYLWFQQVVGQLLPIVYSAYVTDIRQKGSFPPSAGLFNKTIPSNHHV